MKEREIFGSSSLSKLRQKNRLIFVFMLKALKYFGLSVSRIVLWDFLEKPWTSSAASSYAILSLLIVLISTATFIVSTFEVGNIVSTALLSHYCHYLIIVITVFEVRFFFLEYLGEKYKCPWRKKNLLLLRIFCGEQGEIGVEFDLKFCNQFCIAFIFRKLFKMKRFLRSSTSLTKPRW